MNHGQGWVARLNQLVPLLFLIVHSRPASFRRILLFQILLLSVPILLIGQYITLRKARTSLLETARQNLISSAMRKSDSLTLGLESLQSSILVLTQTTALQTGTVAEASSTLTSLSRSLPFQLDCVQLLAVETNTAIINTCNQPQLLKTAPDWPQSAAANPATDFHLTAVPTANLGKASDHEAHLTMAIAAPVYTPAGRLRYTLSLQAQLTQVQNAAPRSLVGYTVVIDDAGQILVHPDSSQQGKIFVSYRMPIA
ncbi:MAG: hypothetical protein HC839_00515 [Leptolyngbyaceae cyanobacterium RM2_2_21]|nr:hypothetical protein [Leptolyngbyaceae cyanobacterium RM2_2_21]